MRPYPHSLRDALVSLQRKRTAAIFRSMVALLCVIEPQALFEVYAAEKRSGVVTSNQLMTAFPPGTNPPASVHLLGFDSIGDGGSADWDYHSDDTTTADNGCTIRVDRAGRRWFAETPLGSFSVDICGTGSEDDSAAFNKAFATCATSRMRLVIPPKDYRFRRALIVPVGCSFKGAGGLGGNGQHGLTILDFSKANDVKVGLSYVGRHGFGQWDPATSFGGFEILGNKTMTTGLYVSRVSYAIASDIAVYNISGPAIFWGTTLQSSLTSVRVGQSGTATTGEIEIDGETDRGKSIGGTALTLQNIYAEGPSSAQCGIKIDRYQRVLLIGGDSESAGIPVCIASKTESQFPVENLLIENFDMEGLTNGADHCIQIGYGWRGKPGAGAVGVQLLNGSCASTSTYAVKASNTYGFRADSILIMTKPGGTAFAFTGVNEHWTLGPLANPLGTGTKYLTVNGIVTFEGIQDLQLFSGKRGNGQVQ